MAATERRVLEPGIEHPITIEPHASRVTVSVAGQPIADTSAALALREASYATVFYIPLADVRMEHLAPSDHRTYCPYKGDCSYYSVPAAGELGVNVVWEYRDPYSAVAAIRGHVAFYRDRAEISEREAL